MNWSPSIVVHVSYPAEIALSPAELAARIAPLLPECDVSVERALDGSGEVHVARSDSAKAERYAFVGIDFVAPGGEPWGRCSTHSSERCRLCHRSETQPRFDGDRRWLEVYSGPDQPGWVDPHLDGLTFYVVRAIERALPSAKADSFDDDEPA
jgi:hypothetical protein